MIDRSDPTGLAALGGGPGRITRQRLLVLDAVCAAVLAGLLVASALTPEPVRALSAPTAVRVLVALVMAGAVATRRLAPLWSLGVGTAACVGVYLLGFERESFFSIALVLYTVGATRAPRRSAAALGAALGPVMLVLVTARAPQRVQMPVPQFWQIAAMALTIVAVPAAGWALGVAVYQQRGYLEAVRTQAAEQVRSQRELAARSAAEERLRIARELHDVVAHAMSVITVQAGVAHYTLAVRPEQVGEALEVIEVTGRQALRDMRRLLGVLRQDGDAAPHAPAPVLADLPDLITSTGMSGVRVELSVLGEQRPLPQGAELCVYRIVQEALTNVVKHAATDHARVRVTYEPLEVAVEVVDDGVGVTGAVSGGGHGLIGMTERAALHGGTVEAGPLPVRGFRVAARLPVPAAVAVAASVAPDLTGVAS